MKSMYLRLTSLVSLLLLFLIVFRATPSLAATPQVIDGFVPSGQLEIILNENPKKEISAVKPLYDADETIIAHCIELSGNGFIVQDIHGNIVEYSLIADSPFSQTAPNKKLYITAPMFYYEKGAIGEFISVYSGTIATKADIIQNNAVRKNIERQDILSKELADTGVSANYLPPSDPVVSSNQTTYTPRNYAYNPTDICLGTSSATLIAYYDDYINQNIAPSSFVDATGQTLTTWLIDHIRIEGSPLSWQNRTKSAINSFISIYATGTGTAMQYTADYISGLSGAYGQLKSKVSANKPVVIVFKGWFYDESISLVPWNHAVCAYGYREVISSNGVQSKYVLCVDGYGSTQRYINSSYVTDCVYLN